MDMSLVKWTPPVQALVRQAPPALPSPPGAPQHTAAPGVIVPRPATSALGHRLVSQYRQAAARTGTAAGSTDKMDQVFVDEQVKLLDANLRRSSESIATLKNLG